MWFSQVCGDTSTDWVYTDVLAIEHTHTRTHARTLFGLFFVDFLSGIKWLLRKDLLNKLLICMKSTRLFFFSYNKLRSGWDKGQREEERSAGSDTTAEQRQSSVSEVPPTTLPFLVLRLDWTELSLLHRQEYRPHWLNTDGENRNHWKCLQPVGWDEYSSIVSLKILSTYQLHSTYFPHLDTSDPQPTQDDCTCCERWL